MTAYTDDDVTAGVCAHPWPVSMTEAQVREAVTDVLDAVAQAIAARALREAADAHTSWYRPEYGVPPEQYVCDECGQRWPCPTGAWLRARAEQVSP